MARNVNPDNIKKGKYGRPKGCPNKVTKSLKDMLLLTVDQLGGQKWFYEVAKSDPRAFMTMLAKIMPNVNTISGSSDPNSTPLEIKISYTKTNKVNEVNEASQTSEDKESL